MNIAHLLVDTITVQSQTGVVNADADPTWGSQRTVKARVEPSSKAYRNVSGTMVQASHEIYTDQPILQTDRLWVPGDDPANESQARMVGSVTSPRSLNGSYQIWEVLVS